MPIDSLTKKQESITFEWNVCDVGFVIVRKFDCDKFLRPRLKSTTYQYIKQARLIWKKYIKMGFKRT